MADNKILSEMSGTDFLEHWNAQVEAGSTFAEFVAGFDVEDSHIKASERKGAKDSDPKFYLRRDVKNLAKELRKSLKKINFNLPAMKGERSSGKTARVMPGDVELKALAKALKLPAYSAAEKKADKEARERALTAQAGKGK